MWYVHNNPLLRLSSKFLWHAESSQEIYRRFLCCIKIASINIRALQDQMGILGHHLKRVDIGNWNGDVRYHSLQRLPAYQLWWSNLRAAGEVEMVKNPPPWHATQYTCRLGFLTYSCQKKKFNTQGSANIFPMMVRHLPLSTEKKIFCSF